MYEDFKISGPYLRKNDNRLIVIIKNLRTNKKSTISYPKYLIECHLNRYLSKDEIVHHKDGNPLNNDISNLEVLSRIYHSTKDHLVNKDVLVTCRMCGKEFLIKGSEISHYNRNDRNNSGYFCSKQCTGKYGSMIQNNKIKSIKVERKIPEKINLIHN